MTRIHSFPPLSRPDAECLILGSMPGRASLLARQYYAHPRNAFWSIVEAIYGIGKGLEYRARCERLTAQHVAVWDVLKTCTRTSSLDSDIDQSSIVANDFCGFFSKHPRIQAVYFNGAMAETSFNRYVLPTLDESLAALHRVRLPSTSPANATFSFERKLEAWRTVRMCRACARRRSSRRSR